MNYSISYTDLFKANINNSLDDRSYYLKIYFLWQMSVEGFQRCLEELNKEQGFNQITFLRLLAGVCSSQIHKQIHLSLYAFYQLSQCKNIKNCLQAVEKGLQIHQQTLGASLLLFIKSASLSQIKKHAQAHQSFKQAMQIVHYLSQKKIQIPSGYKKIFPNFLARILMEFDFSRGRRQFLVMLDEIKSEIAFKPGFQFLQSALVKRLSEIRESMRCAGKSQHQKKLLLGSSSSMGALGYSRADSNRNQQSTSIYISRLYQDRRKNLAQRDNSAFKKNLSNPYQLNLADTRLPKSQCFLM